MFKIQIKRMETLEITYQNIYLKEKHKAKHTSRSKMTGKRF